MKLFVAEYFWNNPNMPFNACGETTIPDYACRPREPRN